MGPIYINTDNSDKKHKIYIAKLAGGFMDDAEGKIQEMVLKAFADDSEFTTNKVDSAKGYTLRFEITKFSATGGETALEIKGEIVRYPKSPTKKGSADEKVMVSRDWSNHAAASGTDVTAVQQCIQAILELMVPKSKPVMTIDMTRR
jgi:hypothetical protein